MKVFPTISINLSFFEIQAIHYIKVTPVTIINVEVEKYLIAFQTKY